MQKKGIKIDFGIAEDIQKVLADGTSVLTQIVEAKKQMEIADKGFEAQLKIADKATATANKVNDTANKITTKIGTILEKAEKSAKDLGIDPKLVAGYTDADKLYTSIENMRKDMNAFNWPIASNVGKSF